MSAWIVSKNHIDALVTWAIDNNLIVKHNGWSYRISDNPDRVGLELWAENHRSVNYRYDEETAVPDYVFKENKQDGLVIFKNIQCYDYQTCECDNYRETFSSAFVNATLEILSGLGYTYDKVRDLKEYDAAPWGIN
jgi:hypothetical protein